MSDDKMQVPHDAFFRAAFSDLTVAKDFLKCYLPKDILRHVELDTLEPQKDSYIDKSLRPQYSDMLYRANIDGKEGYFYLLAEHKSYNDKMSILQLLKYMVSVWETKAGKEGQDELPMILPMLVYHNKGEWKAHMKLSDWIKDYSSFPEEIKKYVPDYEYLLHDLGKYVKDKIAKDVRTELVINMLDRGRYASKEELIEMISEAIKVMAQLRVNGESTDVIAAFIAYTLGIREDISEEEVIRIAGSVSEDGGEFVMTVAEKLRKEEKVKIAKKAIIKGYRVEDIMDLTDLTEKEIEEVKEDMLKS